MGAVIDLETWRADRRRAPTEGAASLDAVVPVRTWRTWHPSDGPPVDARSGAEPGAGGHVPVDPETVARLERAIARIDGVASRLAERGRPLDGPTETQLYALMGQLAVGSVREATERAERLADRLVGRARTSRSGA